MAVGSIDFGFIFQNVEYRTRTGGRRGGGEGEGTNVERRTVTFFV